MTDWDGWHLVDAGCTTAVVRRSPAGMVHAKTATTPLDAAELAAERDRLGWLATTDVPVPRVVDWLPAVADEGPTMVTSTIPGVPLSELSWSASIAGVAALLDVLHLLHALPVEQCPFDTRLRVRVPEAARRVAAGLVDVDDLDDERRGRAPEQLLEDLEATAVEMTALEADDLAVCHGDLCLPNVLVDERTHRLTGVIDVGRLGVADRHQDLALATRSLAMPGLNPAYGPDRADQLLAEYAWHESVHPPRIDYYRLLDEFF